MKSLSCFFVSCGNREVASAPLEVDGFVLCLGGKYEDQVQSHTMEPPLSKHNFLFLAHKLSRNYSHLLCVDFSAKLVGVSCQSRANSC